MQLAFGAIGAAIGAPFGMAGIGFSIATGIYGMLQKPEKQVNSQPMMDLRIPGTQDGRPIPWIRGALRVAPDWAWHSDRRAIPNTTTTEAGKGGGQEVENTTITYEHDALYLLTINPGIGVIEVYDSGELISRIDIGASAGTIAASNASEHWDRMTVYNGDPSQLPDPDYEAWVDANVGAGQAPAYRGRITVFMKGIKLGTGGQPRQFEFVAVVDGAQGSGITYYDGLTTVPTGNLPQVSFVQSRGELWATDHLHSMVSGTPDRIGIYTFASQTWEYITLESPWHELAINSGVFLYVVPEWDMVYVNTREPGVGYTCLVYQLSTRQFVGALHDLTGGIIENTMVGVDAANSRALIFNSAGGYRLYTIESGLPAILLLELGGSSPGNVRALADADGVFWIVASTGIIRIHPETGLTTIALGADGAHGGAWESVYDSTRNVVFYWSNLSPAGEHLKKIDCATSVLSRVNAVAYGTTGYVPSLGVLVMASDRDQVISVQDHKAVFLLDPDSGAIDEQIDIDQGTGAHFEGGCDYASGILWGPSDDDSTPATGFGELRLNVITPECVSVAAFQSSVCVRSGLTTGQIDVTPLASITRTICAFPWSQISAARVPTELACGTYFYLPTMSGTKLKFVPRGGSEVATIPYADLGARLVGEGGDDDPLPLRMVNDLEMPAQQGINFINLASNYQPGHELSDRLISATPVTVEPMDVPIGMQPGEAKGVIDTALRDRASALLRTRIKLLRSDYPTLEPTDPIIVTGKDGSQYRMRTEQMIDKFPIVELDLVLDDPSVLVAQGITTTDYESQTTVTAPANTVMRLADLPLLQDSDNAAGFYGWAKGDRTPYPGSAIIASDNNVDYAQAATIAESAIFGSCTTALGNWTGPRVFDNLNSVTVNVGDATLTSSTRALVLGSETVNAFAIGNDSTGYELGQFIDATLVSPGVYTLTRLLRGSRGTEWRMTGHVTGERFILLRRQGMRRVTLTNAQLGASRYYKGITTGRSDSTATAQVFTANGVSLKPFVPVRARVTRDGSNNATISWETRSRFAVRMVGALGISVPPDETVEAWSIDFYTDGTYTTLATTKTSSTTSYVFSAADQTTAGLTPGNDLFMDIKKVSAIVGGGYPLRRAA